MLVLADCIIGDIDLASGKVAEKVPHKISLKLVSFHYACLLPEP